MSQSVGLLLLGVSGLLLWAGIANQSPVAALRAVVAPPPSTKAPAKAAR